MDILLIRYVVNHAIIMVDTEAMMNASVLSCNVDERNCASDVLAFYRTTHCIVCASALRDSSV